MNWQGSSAKTSPQKLRVSDQPLPALPMSGLEALARLWAGAGTLLDWIAPQDWDFQFDWEENQARARVAELILIRFARDSLPFLPHYAGQWADLLTQQIERSVGRSDVPTAHTDWPATIAEFGRYPSPLYVERRTTPTYDTPHTRVLKWTSHATRRAESMVLTHFGRRALDPRAREALTCPLQLVEVASASDCVQLSDLDLRICKSSGGAWLLVARLAEQLSALSSRSPITQLQVLAPTLPEIAFQLFEIGTLGTIINALRASCVEGSWTTMNPLAAARTNQPCLTWHGEDGRAVRAFFQTVPSAPIYGESPYYTLARQIGGGVLRPDSWVDVASESASQFIVECKYSLDPSYVSNAISELLAYDAEFGATEARRVLLAIGPSEVVARPAAIKGRVVLCSPDHAASAIAAAWNSKLDELLRNWEVD